MRNVLFLLALYLDLINSYVVRQNESVRTSRQVEVQNKKRIVCYYSSWSIKRAGESKFRPEDINPHLCTHLIYAFAIVNEGDIVPLDPQTAFEYEGFVKFTKMKKYNKNVKVMLSVGGTKEGSTRFSNLVSDAWTRKQFPRNARVFLQKNNFDGLDIDWHHPGGLTLGSKSSDKENFVELLKGLKEDFKDEFCLSISVPKYKTLIDKGYDISGFTPYLDFMNVLTYDYHNPTDAFVNHVSPLYSISKSNRDENVDATIRHYLGIGVDPGMLNMGIPLYGVTFILEDPTKTDIGSRTEDEGPGIRQRGEIYFNELCDKFSGGNWTIKHLNKTAMGPYAYMNNQWMAFDDEDMVKTKARYAASKNLGGIMFWSIDMDDFKARCHTRTYPMIRGAKEAFLSKLSQESNTTTPDATTSKATISTETTPTRPATTTSTAHTSTETTPTRPATTTSISHTSTETTLTRPTIIPSLATDASFTGSFLPSPRPNSRDPRESSVTFPPLPTSVPTAVTSSKSITTYVFPKTVVKIYHSNDDINIINVHYHYNKKS